MIDRAPPFAQQGARGGSVFPETVRDGEGREKNRFLYDRIVVQGLKRKEFIMKNLKAKIRPEAKTRSFASLPEKEKLAQRFKKVEKMECPCCGKTMYLEENVWRCHACAYCVTQSDMLREYVFWFCDECGRFMNVQPGFSDKTGAWKCISCGFVNDVSKENVID